MVKDKFTKLVMVTFVDGDIKGAHDATWSDIELEIAKCSGEELETLCELVGAEYAKRLGRTKEEEEQIALGAMCD